MSPLSLRKTQRGWSVCAGAEPLLFFSTDPRYRTHIHPLHAPGTICPLTRFRPWDHPWQYGVFVGLNQVNGLDFWCSGDAYYEPPVRGTMRCRAVTDVREDARGVGFTAVNDWTGPDSRPVLEERQHIFVPHQDTAVRYVVDFDWELIARHGEVNVGASSYGGLSVRLVGEAATRRHLNSERHSGDQCAEAAARWCCVAQPVDGVGTYSAQTRETYAYAGVAVFDHPTNIGHPRRWRVDGQGMINPCRALSGAWQIPHGQRVRDRYRLFVFLGLPDYDTIETAYQHWVRQP